MFAVTETVHCEADCRYDASGFPRVPACHRRVGGERGGGRQGEAGVYSDSVSKSSHNDPPGSPNDRFLPSRRPLCEPILTQRHSSMVWQCNHKYDGGEKCKTPVLTDDELKENTSQRSTSCSPTRNRLWQIIVKSSQDRFTILPEWKGKGQNMKRNEYRS